MRFAVEPVHPLRLAAVRAVGAIGPADRFQVLPRLGLVRKNRVGKIDRHAAFPR